MKKQEISTTEARRKMGRAASLSYTLCLLAIAFPFSFYVIMYSPDLSAYTSLFNLVWLSSGLAALLLSYRIGGDTVIPLVRLPKAYCESMISILLSSLSSS